MAERQLAVGDPVLWQGQNMSVTAIHERPGGVQIAEPADASAAEAEEAKLVEGANPGATIK